MSIRGTPGRVNKCDINGYVMTNRIIIWRCVFNNSFINHNVFPLRFTFISFHKTQSYGNPPSFAHEIESKSFMGRNSAIYVTKSGTVLPANMWKWLI